MSVIIIGLNKIDKFGAIELMVNIGLYLGHVLKLDLPAMVDFIPDGIAQNT